MKTQMNVMAIAMLVLAPVAAHADGFTCGTPSGDLVVKAYNHTDPSEGTRVGSVLVISDPAVSQGLKTIARFTDVNDTLTSTGSSYLANVDLRFADSRKGGRLIAGTKLMYLDTIRLDVDYNYNEPVEAGTELNGQLVLTKRNGEQISRVLICNRYLKGSSEE